MARSPKPTALKLVTGVPGKRAVNKNEPDPDYLNDLTPPQHLSVGAAVVWTELAPKLRKARLLTEIDTVQFEMLCVSLSNYRFSTQMVENSHVYSNPENGAKSTNPWTIVQSMSFKQVLAASSKFAMSPVDRARVSVNPQASLFDDPAEGFFSKKK